MARLADDLPPELVGWRGLGVCHFVYLLLFTIYGGQNSCPTTPVMGSDWLLWCSGAARWWSRAGLRQRAVVDGAAERPPCGRDDPLSAWRGFEAGASSSSCGEILRRGRGPDARHVVAAYGAFEAESQLKRLQPSTSRAVGNGDLPGETATRSAKANTKTSPASCRGRLKPWAKVRQEESSGPSLFLLLRYMIH